MRGTKFLLVSVVAGCLLAGCGDPKKKLAGKYDLELFPDGGYPYTVVDAKHGGDEGGVFAGEVIELGLNKDWILAYVSKNTYKAFTDPHGWYALDMRDGHVIGPIPEESIKTDPVWSAIKVRPSALVFAENR